MAGKPPNHSYRAEAKFINHYVLHSWIYICNMHCDILYFLIQFPRTLFCFEFENSCWNNSFFYYLCYKLNFCWRNYSRENTIQGRKLYEETLYDKYAETWFEDILLDLHKCNDACLPSIQIYTRMFVAFCERLCPSLTVFNRAGHQH